jgi:hypothetical protein
VLVKKETCAYKKQYPGASEQNISNYFSHLRGNPSFIQHCVRDIRREEKRENKTCESVKWLKGAELQQTLRMC